MATAPTFEAPPLTKRQLALTAFVLSFSNFIVVLDMTVANVSIPHIAGSLGVSVDQGTWVITSYSVAEAVMVPLTGWLTQRFGSVRLYLSCMAGFGFFSFVCGISMTIEMIILARIAQGLCGGLLMPLSQMQLLRIFRPEQRGRAMLLAAMTTLLGPAFGPNLGGYISDNMSWHWIFLINVPLVLICVGLIYSVMWQHETPRRRVPIDRVGLILLFTWIGCLQFMLDIGRNRDWFSDPLVAVLGLVALIGFVMFIIWELTDEHPVVDLRIFRYRGFSAGVVALSLCYGAYFASIVVVPQWLQLSMGYPATMAGLITSCTALAALTTAHLASKALPHSDARLLVSLAMVWMGSMAFVRSHWTSGADLYAIAAPQVIQGFAMSFFMLPLTTLTLGAVRPDELASASGIQNFLRTIAAAISAAIALTVWGDTQQEAHAELVGNLRPDQAMGVLTQSGMSTEQARAMIAAMVDKEAVTMAVDYVFLLTTVAFFVCAAIVWISPRPKAITVAPGH